MIITTHIVAHYIVLLHVYSSFTFSSERVTVGSASTDTVAGGEFSLTDVSICGDFTSYIWCYSYVVGVEDKSIHIMLDSQLQVVCLLF